MNYHRINGALPVHTTGIPTNVASTLKDGFDKFECGGLDATEFMPAGGMKRIEWESTTDKKVCNWFETQISIFRAWA